MWSFGRGPATRLAASRGRAGIMDGKDKERAYVLLLDRGGRGRWDPWYALL
jgi:hypothetical protein